MTRRIYWLSVLVLLIVGGFAAVWLFTTESGLRWAYARLHPLVPGSLDIRTLSGTLAGPLTVGGLRYRSDRLDADLDDAQLDWSPSSLLLGRLQIDRFVVNNARLALKETEAPAAEEPRDVSFPLNLQLANVSLKNISIERPEQAPYTIRSVELAGYIGQEIARIERLEIDAENFQVTADGTLGLGNAGDQQLDVAWRAQLPEQRAIAGSGIIAGGLADLRIEQQLTEPTAATVRARVRKPLGALAWEASVELPDVSLQRLGVDAPIKNLRASVAASGDRRRFEATGTASARVRDFPRLTADFRLQGDITGKVELEQLTARLADTKIRLRAQGGWEPAANTWRARVRWQDLRWPLTGDATAASPEGALTAGGTLENYDVQLEAVTLGEDIPRAEWRASGSGDRKQIAWPDITIATLGTTFRGAASAAWSPRLQWQAQLNGRAIDPAVVLPEWPGSLALGIKADGDGERMRVNVDELRGTLRGHPISATARAVRHGANYPTLALQLQSGSAKAKVSGNLTEQWQLDWTLDVPQLRVAFPGANGRFNSTGRVTGPRATPRIEAEGSGAGIEYQTTRVATLAFELALDLSDRTRSRASLRASGGSVLGRDFEQARLNASGQIASHSIGIDLRLPGPSLQAELEGQYADGQWRGSLASSRLRIGDADWRLTERAALTLAPGKAALADACWRASAARLCLALDHAEAGTALAADAQQLPLELFRPLLAEAIDVNGTVSGTATAQLEGGAVRVADARFDFSPGTVAVAAAKKTSFSYKSVQMRAVVDDAGLHANVKLAMPNGDGGSARVALPRFHSDVEIRNQPVEGVLTVNLRDLAPLDVLLLQVDELRGVLRADLSLAGSLADPQLRGDVTLGDASATVPAIGVSLQQTRLTATATGGHELRLSGEAHSGGGQVGLSGRVMFPRDRAWRAELRIAGAQFQAANLRDAQVYVSPDLRARMAPGEVHVTGEVRIPKATFVLGRREAGAVAPSPDVVIVNDPGTEAQQAPWAVTAEVRVILGEAVTFSGFGLSANIKGNVVLVEIPGQATTARGDVGVAEGEYEAYGQKLQVERGRLLFVGGPVDNPGIDARAVRKVDNVTVGVEVKGTLRDPQLSLFSNPAMSQSDNLSYLLFGRPLQGASTSEGRSMAAAARALKLAGGERLAQRLGARFGIEEVDIETGTTPETAALVLGKRLSPRLYVNYSIGLFEPANVLRLRYELSRRWSLEAQSGKSAGGDLLFTIER